MMKDQGLETSGMMGAMLPCMTTTRHLISLVALVSVSACYQPDRFANSTLPEPAPEPVQMGGPPGGAMDPPPGYAQQGYQPQGSQEGPQVYAEEPQQAQMDPNGDPNAQAPGMGEGTGDVNDVEIDATLDGYGQWEDNDDYGKVWRPDATAVGSAFTPYETAGSWVETDAGWGYSSEWDWGWLPFHYGRWGWFGNGWGWQPGHQWGAAWVDWRHGGGYVGWRPQSPIARVGGVGLASHDSQWRFATEGDFGRAHIRAHEFKDPAGGFPATPPVTRLGSHGSGAPVHASSLMGARLASNARINASGGIHTPGARSPGLQSSRPAFRQPDMRNQPTWRQQSVRQGSQQPYRQQGYRPQQQSYRPSYRPQSTYRSSPSRSYSAPSHSSSSSSSHSSGGSSHSSGGGHPR